MKKMFKPLLFSLFLLAIGCSEAKADTVDNYQIYLGERLELTEASFSPYNATIPGLRLNISNYSEELRINYNHCSAGATGRQIKLVDLTDKVIMHWKFDDTSAMMRIPVQEILSNPSVKKNTTLQLFYADNEYPAWVCLTPVFIQEKPILIRKDESSIYLPKIITGLFFLTALCCLFLVWKFKFRSAH